MKTITIALVTIVILIVSPTFNILSANLLFNAGWQLDVYHWASVAWVHICIAGLFNRIN